MRTFVLVLLAACGADYVSGDPPPSGAGEPVAAYRDNCASCHGAGGDGTADAPQIREPVHAFATYVISRRVAALFTSLAIDASCCVCPESVCSTISSREFVISKFSRVSVRNS